MRFTLATAALVGLASAAPLSFTEQAKDVAAIGKRAPLRWYGDSPEEQAAKAAQIQHLAEETARTGVPMVGSANPFAGKVSKRSPMRKYGDSPDEQAAMEAQKQYLAQKTAETGHTWVGSVYNPNAEKPAKRDLLPPYGNTPEEIHEAALEAQRRFLAYQAAHNSADATLAKRDPLRLYGDSEDEQAALEAQKQYLAEETARTGVPQYGAVYNPNA